MSSPDQRRSLQAHRKDGAAVDCPYGDDIAEIKTNVKNLLRRLQVIDGDQIDKTGGTLGRTSDTVQEHEIFLRRMRAIMLVAFGMILAQGAAGILLYRTVADLARLVAK